MATPDTKTENRAQLRDLKRRQILDAAKRIFAEHGLEAATMREIAAAAGCTTGAIYPLFPATPPCCGNRWRMSRRQCSAAWPRCARTVRS